MSKRLAYLEMITSEGSADSFGWYCLALEYTNLSRFDDAEKTFGKLREKDSAYVPMYLMCGNMLIKAGKKEEAKSWLEDGVQVAKSKGDSKALGEIQEALQSL